MADVTPGIYEQFVTKQLQLRLAALDDALVDRGQLGPADALNRPTIENDAQTKS